MKRTLWEIGIAVVLLAACYGIWAYQTSRLERELAAAEEACDAQVEAMRERAEAWAEALGRGEALSVFRAFAAGVHGDLVAGRHNQVDNALGDVVRIGPVVFVHVLDAEGGVIASSDRKRATTGEVGVEGEWALAADDVETRQLGDGPLEVAGPIYGAEKPVAYVWLGYDVEGLLERRKRERG